MHIFFHHQSLMIFLFLVSTSTSVLTDEANETTPPTNADEQVSSSSSSSSSSPAITSAPSNSSKDSIDNNSSSTVSECPPDHSGEHRGKDNQYEDYPSFDNADRPYFGRVRLPDDTLYLAGLQLEPMRTMNNLLCVELAMVVVFGLILSASNYINTRRQKCYYAKIHAAWGVVHGGGGGGVGGGKAESASIGTTAAPKKKSSISAQPR